MNVSYFVIAPLRFFMRDREKDQYSRILERLIRDARVVTEVESATARRAWQSLRSRDAGDRCRAPIAPLDAEVAWHGSL
jgi:hypothetical protein